MKPLNTMNLLITVESLKYKTMSAFYFMCTKNTESINPRVKKNNNGKIILSKCAACGSKKSRFI